jgi:hypothetical protein
VARWLAAQVGAAGQVVATDADPRFLADAEKAGVEVRRHDILADPVEPGHYDLAHCRALLFHLADPQRAVRNMVAAVRPGGWLLIEDADYVSLVAANPAHPRAGRFDQVTQELSAFFAASGILDPFIGRCLPSFVTAAGLTDTGFEAVACLRQGGSAEADLLRRSLDRLHPLALTNGVASQHELAAVSAATADPSFSFVDALSVAAWGRVPDPAHVAHSWGGGAACMGKPPIPLRRGGPTVCITSTYDTAARGASHGPDLPGRPRPSRQDRGRQGLHAGPGGRPQRPQPARGLCINGAAAASSRV